MDRQINLAAQQRLFQFGGEDALAADGWQWRVERTVALRGDDTRLRLQPWPGAQQRLTHVIGLPAREFRAACSQVDCSPWITHHPIHSPSLRHAPPARRAFVWRG